MGSAILSMRPFYFQWLARLCSRKGFLNQWHKLKIRRVAGAIHNLPLEAFVINGFSAIGNDLHGLAQSGKLKGKCASRRRQFLKKIA
jgi:hypothetical protein